MRVPKRPFVFYNEIRNFTVVPKQTFVFYSETRNFTVVPKRPFVFHSEIRNFTVAPKQTFVFLQWNIKFYSCTETAICCFFLQQNTKFRIVPKQPFILWLRNTKFLKLFRNFNLLICLSTQFNFHSLLLQEVLMRTHFFTAVFPTINHWFEEAVVGTGNNLSIVFLWIKCNTKFNNASSFVSHCKKAKQDISKS